MATVANKRSVMSLYSDPAGILSHRVRIVLAEKGINVDIIDVKQDDIPEELGALNPYGTMPTLVDRDLVVYESKIIMEYLDERFPHPPLMPVYPVTRAEYRLHMYRIDKDLYKLYFATLKGTPEERERAKGYLVDNLTSLSPVFAEKPFFLSDEMTLVDCCFAPLLWRLPMVGIELPPQAKAVKAYAKRMFEREGFRASLTESELEFKDARIMEKA